MPAHARHHCAAAVKRAATLLCLLVFSSAAIAHWMPAQQGSINLVDKDVFLVAALPVSALSGVDDDRDGRLSGTELLAHTQSIKDQIAWRLRLLNDQAAGQLAFLQVMTDPDGAEHFVVLMKVSFAGAPENLQIETDLFGNSDKERQLTLKATRGADTEAVVLTPLHASHIFFRSPAQVLLNYLLLGVEHILLGMDHLLFLLTILVAAAGWRYWLGVLTSFTVAHSITLTASLMGWLQAPAAVVEPMIAASIVLMALLNLTQRSAALHRRMAIVFACGLLHGLGFASAMMDMGLHGAYRVTSVVGFNLGIELGQVLFLIAILALVRSMRLLGLNGLLQQMGLSVPLTKIASVFALCVGGFWFLQRLGV
ncbi:MAG: HupE/UreJ family protein [Burkholderiales bacterium]|nr:HupE/UreJ family protein [Burkholderiales bacterium]